MEKQEFLERLQVSLNGKVAPETVTDTLSYYEEYINTEIQTGKTEDEVMSALGDPRLIARTIVETKGGQLNRQTSGMVDEAEQRFDGSAQLQKRVSGIPGWVWLVCLLVIVILILSLAFKILSALWPFLLVMAVVLFFTNRFRQ